MTGCVRSVQSRHFNTQIYIPSVGLLKVQTTLILTYNFHQSVYVIAQADSNWTCTVTLLVVQTRAIFSSCSTCEPPTSERPVCSDAAELVVGLPD
jgi:hypothetical protein